jgi:hypothetical protein
MIIHKLNICLNVARLYEESGEKESALHMYEKILRIQQNMFPQNHSIIEQTRLHMGLLSDKSKKTFAK